MLTVYHGSTYRVEQPLAGVCRPNLDFGVGFYLTNLKDQAIRWALRTAAATLLLIICTLPLTMHIGWILL